MRYGHGATIWENVSGPDPEAARVIKRDRNLAHLAHFLFPTLGIAAFFGLVAGEFGVGLLIGAVVGAAWLLTRGFIKMMGEIVGRPT